MYRNKKTGVVVPAWNEEPHIGKVLASMPDFVDVVYVVDDASTDRTADIVRDFATLHSQVDVLAVSQSGQPGTQNAERRTPRVELIQHAVNRGVGAAIVSGYKRALADGMDIAAVMAGDNQMDPALLPSMLDPVVEGRGDYSKGTRMTVAGYRGGMTMWRTFGNWLLRRLTAVASGNPCVTDPQNGYSAISKKALETIDLEAVYPYYGYCNDLVARLTANDLAVVEVPTPQVINEGQKSKIRYGRYMVKVSGLLLRLFLLRITGRLATRHSPPLSVTIDTAREPKA